VLKQEKQYAALAPLLALAGIFIHPMATTILPLILYFLFNWRRMGFARLVAIRAADLGFTIHLFLIISSALLGLYINYNPMPGQEAQAINQNVTLVFVVYLMVSLLIGAVQAFRGKAFSYILSLKIAERLFRITTKT